MKKAALFGFGAAAGTAVQKHDRLAGGIAAFLEVDLVDGRDLQPARVIRFEGRIEPTDWILHHGFANAIVGHAEQYKREPNNDCRHRFPHLCRARNDMLWYGHGTSPRNFRVTAFGDSCVFSVLGGM